MLSEACLFLYNFPQKGAADMWIKYNPNPVGRTTGVDCSVRAVSKALGVDWETAYVMIALNGLFESSVIS